MSTLSECNFLFTLQCLEERTPVYKSEKKHKAEPHNISLHQFWKLVHAEDYFVSTAVVAIVAIKM